MAVARERSDGPLAPPQSEYNLSPSLPHTHADWAPSVDQLHITLPLELTLRWRDIGSTKCH